MNDFKDNFGISGERALLARAARELKTLRQHNSDMRIRLRAFDDVIACFDKRPAIDMPQTFISSDVVKEIEQLLEDGK